MPRTLSPTARRALYAAQTDEQFVTLLRLSGTGIATIYVCDDAVDVVSRGDTYLAFPFRIDSPPENEDKLEASSLIIDNVDQQIVQAVRLITAPMRVEMEVVLASAPDTVELGPVRFSLREVRYDALTIQGRLLHEDVLNEPFPADAFTPGSYPGLF